MKNALAGIGSLLWFFGGIGAFISGLYLAIKGFRLASSFLESPIGFKPLYEAVNPTDWLPIGIFAVCVIAAFVGKIIHDHCSKEREHEQIAKTRREIMGGGK